MFEVVFQSSAVSSVAVRSGLVIEGPTWKHFVMKYSARDSLFVWAMVCGFLSDKCYGIDQCGCRLSFIKCTECLRSGAPHF